MLVQIAALQRPMVSDSACGRNFFLRVMYPVLHMFRETGSVEWVSMSCTTCGKKIVGTGGIVSGILNVSGKRVPAQIQNSNTSLKHKRSHINIFKL